MGARPASKEAIDDELLLVDEVRKARPRLTKLARQLDAEADLKKRRQLSGELYAALFQLGLQQLEVPAEGGGLGLRPTTRALILEELARADGGAAMAIKTTASVLGLLHSLEREELQKAFIRPALEDQAGRFLFGNAGTEPDHGSDAVNFAHDASLATTLKKARGGYALSGEKWMMTNCATAAAYVVVAQLKPGLAGRVFAIVDADAPGVSALPVQKRGLRTAFHGTLHLDQVQVPEERVVIPGKLPEATLRALHAASLAHLATELAAISLGVAQGALDVVEPHVRERVQGGRPLREHPAVALRLSELSQGIHAARGLVRAAAEAVEAGAPDLSLAAAARAEAVEASRRACRVGLDLVGSPGVLEEHPLSKLTRDADTLAVPFGSPDLLRVLGVFAAGQEEGS